MSNVMGTASSYGLENHGLHNLNMEYWTLTTPALVERIVSRREGVLAHEGAVVVRTGIHTGRAANDKFITPTPAESEKIAWGKVNKPISIEHFQLLFNRMTAYFQGRDIFVQDAFAVAHPAYRLPIRVITENAWHSLFARNLFIRQKPEDLATHKPEFTVLHAPGFRAIPDTDGTASDVFIVLNFEQRVVLIGGTSYAGEIKKSIFTALNYLMPAQGVLPMHCAANVDAQEEVALFFGLSGTGKTTLVSDPDRLLIGDDEHGWGDDGVFNFEGGCYAKTIRLKQELEPVIWGATRHFGAVLENVYIDAHTRRVNFDDSSYTENTRAGYPLGFNPRIVPSGRSGHASTIFFLAADAFGVLPPISRLTPEQAMYHFLSGYTAKLAGTEKGLGNEPQTTFSTCFGAPFLPLPASVYAGLLGEKLRKHNAQVWLVNTGWTGGSFGVGKRIDLPYTRALVHAALRGDLDRVPMRVDPFFGFAVPTEAPGVPAKILNPRSTWSDPLAYDQQAQSLAGKFKENFKQFAGVVSAEVAAAGPA
ncbi:MAG: phosphoenolpyruvate carboxykinase (ATP) [Chloroflexi bacterium]|nr:phosphoenolpyruvate carboxykinase (ATP) [Chloroflexota bacterium]